MPKIENFEDLEIWKQAVEIAVKIYKLSEQGKLKNNFGLKDQITRAAISISSNIAEGFERRSKKEFIHFLNIAKASAGELRSQLYVMFQIEYIPKKEYDILHQNLLSMSKQIAGFMKYLQQMLQKNES